MQLTKVRPFIAICAALVIASSFATSSVATPSEELIRSVRSGGAAEVGNARPEQFVAAYTAVIARVSVRQLPDYVTAAIRLRPDLSTQITASSIRAAIRNAPNRQILTAVVERIVRAAILANPDAAIAIARAAIEAAPALRDSIVAAAISAAPQQRLAILQATAPGTSLAGILRAAGSEGDFSVGFGTMSPANFSDTGGNVNSPEQPPTRP